MQTEKRVKSLMDELSISQVELEKRSGISRQVWSNSFRGKQRMNSDHIEFICKEFPEYAMWIVSGFNNSKPSEITVNDVKTDSALKHLTSLGYKVIIEAKG